MKDDILPAYKKMYTEGVFNTYLKYIIMPLYELDLKRKKPKASTVSSEESHFDTGSDSGSQSDE